MEQTATQSTFRYWIYFIIWLALFVYFVFFNEQEMHWFWATLPGVITNFVFAMKLVDKK
ncbi:MAG: hypothetical protein QM528_08635 [Phycisphaerales bacterium]|nr:hypothetical protein [Phycisphaerales bacterium]